MSLISWLWIIADLVVLFVVIPILLCWDDIFAKRGDRL